ncbi:hypothetical protein [Nocardia transvalensis]|uniref:hypothetical protein n=1 Tax=Nocardia transvalensis TaxID=37333 RepID=UPI00189610EF|nr:hypothetical protein [Nocardia transvalensis]MBF6328735.1 hypothetical protein [Nocardia transvalensis]
MNPIAIVHGETWEVLRGGRDRVGDQALTVHHTIDQCVFWLESITGDNDRRTASTAYGNLAVPSEAEALATDHFRRAGTAQLWLAVGGAHWDQLHPMTGWNPGYKLIRIKGVS